MKRWFSRLAVLVLLSTAVAVGGGGRAEAHPLWWCGDQCNFENPQTYVVLTPFAPYSRLCASDAIIPAGRTVTFATNGTKLVLELRYSPLCETVWGRIRGGTKGTHFVIFTRDNWSTGIDQYEVVAGSDRTWGNMVNDHRRLMKVCVGPSHTAPVWGCTTTY